MKKEEYGVGALTSEWHLPPLGEAKQPEKNYKKLNEMAVDARIVKANQVRDFRSNLNVRLQKKQSVPVNRVASVQAFGHVVIDRDPRNPAALPTFGKPNRAQTPVKGIVNGDYGQSAENYYRLKQEENFAKVSV